jgi:hypothetical protein
VDGRPARLRPLRGLQPLEARRVLLAELSSAAPRPYQPGSTNRAWFQANTQGIARRSASVRRPVRRAGREPMAAFLDRVDGRRLGEEIEEAVGLDQRA